MLRQLTFAMVVLASSAFAQGAGTVKDGKVLKSARDEIQRLQKELDDQRALLIKILEVQQQQYTMLLKLARGEMSAADVKVSEPMLDSQRSTSVAAAPVAPSPAPTVAEISKSSGSRSSKGGATATLTGKVTFSGGSAPAWVFVEDVKGSGGGSLEIKQEDKQFSPRVAAVPRGTKLVFANYDNIFHNVFSVSQGNAFDLGNTRAGEAPKSHVAVAPGVVDIFCNMHSKMSASVLVTPGPLMARVQSDGSFKIDDVPVGQHKIGAWAGGTKVVSKDVEVGAGGGEVSFQLEAGEAGAHKNKQGQSYGSYAD